MSVVNVNVNVNVSRLLDKLGPVSAQCPATKSGEPETFVVIRVFCLGRGLACVGLVGSVSGVYRVSRASVRQASGVYRVAPKSKHYVGTSPDTHPIVTQLHRRLA